jgi:hypothetical protein
MDAFDQYWNLFVAAGKPLNEMDRHRACTEWVSLSDSDHEPAILSARGAIKTASGVDYIPYPVNHLRGKAWRRTAYMQPPEPVEFKLGKFEQGVDPEELERFIAADRQRKTA